MARSGFFTGLDIGTDTIKVLVAEFINGSMNVIGVGQVPSQGVKDGIIVDIDAAAECIHQAIEQAQDKAGITIEEVAVGLPAKHIQIEQAHGMSNNQRDAKEILDEDVSAVVASALNKNRFHDREVISFVPSEFIIDGFRGIRDPRGMMGMHLEVKGLIYTGPSTILHNLRRAVEQSGVRLGHVLISSFVLAQSVLNEGEREFGATVIDIGSGQTSVVSMCEQKITFSEVYPEAGYYVTKDVSKCLTVSLQTAEQLKQSFGSAYARAASETDTVSVEVIGKSELESVTEHRLAEIIESRMRQAFETIRKDLSREHLLTYPGGIVLTGGGAILPGVVELAQEVFYTGVKLHVPSQVGIRNPIFATIIGLVEYVGTMSEVEHLVRVAVVNEERLMRTPTIESSRKIDKTSTVIPPKVSNPAPTIVETEQEQEIPVPDKEPKEPKKKLGDRVRGLFGNMFD